MSTRRAREIVAQAVNALIPTHPEFADIGFAPHDFRRLLATELVNNGLPIHIGAALLGHLDVQTTRGYVAVFPEDVITHYQQFLETSPVPTTRRRIPTTHQRRLERISRALRQSTRRAGVVRTSLRHTVCTRTRLHPVPNALDQSKDAAAPRRTRSRPDQSTRTRDREDWRGEIEGIELTLTFLRAKRNQAQRALPTRAAVSVNLGMPATNRSQHPAAR